MKGCMTPNVLFLTLLALLGLSGGCGGFDPTWSGGWEKTGRGSAIRTESGGGSNPETTGGEGSAPHPSPASAFSQTPSAMSSPLETGGERRCLDEIPPLVIDEIAYDPAAVPDHLGEYIEIVNTGDRAVEMGCVRLRVGEGCEAEIPHEAPPLAPGGYFLFVRSLDRETNGGIEGNARFSCTLGNEGGRIELLDPAGTPIDTVTYRTEAPWPSPPAGVAIELIDPSRDNDDGRNWAPASETLESGDRGSPGHENAPVRCGDPTGEILIDEILYDPAAVADRMGEYVELFNPGEVPVDLSCWRLSGDGKESVIEGGTIPAGGFFLLGRSLDPVENGGIAVDAPFTFSLNNGGETLRLLTPEGGVADEVPYRATPPWPEHTPGVSIELHFPAGDNADGTLWRLSETPRPNGDYGTPGAANGGG